MTRSERNAFDEALSEDLRRLAARRRLRDAAPDLLAALEAIIANGALEEYKMYSSQPAAQALYALDIAARAAIAKAKGNHHV